MKELFIIGAGKFALEMADYIEDSTTPDGLAFSVAGYLSLPEEAAVAPEAQTRPFDLRELDDNTYYALGIADMDLRVEVLRRLPGSAWLRFPRLIHRTASVARSADLGPGVVVGPMSRIGVNASVGAFSVLNYLCAVSNHSKVGLNTFLTPGFQSGNSIDVGDHCLFGVNSLVGPAVRVGAESRVQAGVAVLENTGPGMSVFSSHRQKAINRGTS